MENSKIEWTNHTFNPWHGCMKVSDGCKNCYAAKQDNRYHHNDPHWGPNSPRKPMSDDYWRQPIKWNRVAGIAGVTAKVFCASMADVFESNETLKHYPSQLMVADARLRLFQLIATTPHLIWQLLTKRPDNIIPVIESIHGPLEMHDFFEDGNKEYLAQYKEAYSMLTNWLNGKPPVNVWLGTSVEDQPNADKRIRDIYQVPAYIRFISYEPALGPINITQEKINYSVPTRYTEDGTGIEWTDPGNKFIGIDWVICGGESGDGSRYIHPDWATSIRDQCKAAGIPFFFKQWGEYLPKCQSDVLTIDMSSIKKIQFKSPHNPDKMNEYFKMGKYLSGSLLDGIEYKEFPSV